MIIKNAKALKQKYSIISFSNPEGILKNNVLIIPSTKKNEEKPVSSDSLTKRINSLFNSELTLVHFKIKF